MDETDALVAEWTRTLGKMEVFARTKALRIPCAPVRTAPEVMHDPHMHERGMLEDIDHPELGPITVPTTPLRLHGLGRRRRPRAPRWASITRRSMAAGWAGRPRRSRR